MKAKTVEQKQITIIRFLISELTGTPLCGKISNPEVGDLVIEATNPFSYQDSLGFLVKKEGSFDGIVIQTLDGRLVNWGNCLFYKIPIDSKIISLLKEQ